MTEPLAGSAHLMRKTLASALPGVLLGLLIGLNETRYPGYVVPFDIIGVLLYSGIAAFVTLLLLLLEEPLRREIWSASCRRSRASLINR